MSQTKIVVIPFKKLLIGVVIAAIVIAFVIKNYFKPFLSIIILSFILHLNKFCLNIFNFFRTVYTFFRIVHTLYIECLGDFGILKT